MKTSINLISLSVVAALALTGCASFNTPMKNAENQVVTCSNWGWGWLGTPIAYASQLKCESDFKEKGYVAFSDVAPPSVAKNSPAESATKQDSAEIEKLHEMYKAGALTQEEFALAKQRLLSR